MAERGPLAYPSVVELRDNQPMKHEIGDRTYFVADVEPLDVDGVRTVQVGTLVFFIGFVALLPFYGRLEEDGRTWWLWMCLSGMGLGLFGLEYCRRRRAYRHEVAAQEPSEG
jgi:hypothetical protein